MDARSVARQKSLSLSRIMTDAPNNSPELLLKFTPPDQIRHLGGREKNSIGKSWPRAIERKGPCLYVCTDGSARACGVGDNPCLVPTLGDPGETSGPRIDRIPPTRPPWWRRQYRELKKLFFSPPRKCPIDRFGPLANGTILKRLRARFG